MLFCHEFENVANSAFLVQRCLAKIAVCATFFAVCNYVVPLFLRGAFCPKEIAEVRKNNKEGGQTHITTYYWKTIENECQTF